MVFIYLLNFVLFAASSPQPAATAIATNPHHCSYGQRRRCAYAPSPSPSTAATATTAQQQHDHRYCSCRCYHCK